LSWRKNRLVRLIIPHKDSCGRATIAIGQISIGEEDFDTAYIKIINKE
jgi:hypothetical protein